MSVQDLRKLAADLRGRLPVATDAAARVCAALRAGTRPETGDVDLILRALTDFDGARVRLMEGRSEGPMPETFEMLSQALDAAAAEASRSERLRGLVGIQGPAALESVLEEVRQAARTGRSPQLELLAELIALAADTGDFQELDDTAELARERLPGTWRPLINAALNRRLVPEERDHLGADTGSVVADTGPHEGGSQAGPPEGGRAEIAPPTPIEGDGGAQEAASSPGEAPAVGVAASAGDSGAAPDGAGPAPSDPSHPSGHERGPAPAVSLRKRTHGSVPVAAPGTAGPVTVPPAPPGEPGADEPADRAEESARLPRHAAPEGAAGHHDRSAGAGATPGTTEDVQEGEAPRPREVPDTADGTTSAPLGAPPAFGAGALDASEIVLEFAEPIGPAVGDGPDALSGGDSRIKEGSTEVPAGGQPPGGTGDRETSDTQMPALAEGGTGGHADTGPDSTPVQDTAAGTREATAQVRRAQAGPPQSGDAQAGGPQGGPHTASAQTGRPQAEPGQVGRSQLGPGRLGPQAGAAPHAGSAPAGAARAGAAAQTGSPQAGPPQAGVVPATAGPVREGSVEGADRGRGAIGADGAGAAAAGRTGTADTRVAEAEVAALRSGRFGLAAWLRTAAGRPGVEAQARRCAGLARAMGDFAGRLSAEFSAAAQGLDARSLADDPAGGILAWAAAIRAGIVHPTPESIRLLDDLVPVVSPYPGLSAYGEAFADAADSGAYLVPGGTTDGRGSQAGQNRQRAVRASVRLLEEGPHRRLEPALVEETWRVLVQPDAPLGRLLAAAARDDTARVDEVADQVAALRVGGAVGELINDTVRWVAGGPVESTTTIWLGGMIGDALEMVARWVSAVKGTASVGTDRLVQALAELRAAIERNEELAAAELSGPVAAGGPVVAAAAGAARLLIRETLELLDGAPVQTTEPPYAHVVNRELLLAPAVQVHPATLVPYEPPALVDLIPVALAAEEEWEAAFEARAAQGDHEGTRGIIAVLERQEPERVLPLRLRREELVRAARSARDERVRDLRARTAQAMREGALSGDAAARIEKTLQDLTGPLRDDFGRVHGVLHELETDIARGTAHNLKLLGGAAGSSAPQP